MTNCPNCGAPYALDSPVCEYCGTAREGLDDDFERDETWGGMVRYRKVSCGRDIHAGEICWRAMPDGYVLDTPTQQTAYVAQTLANAANDEANRRMSDWISYQNNRIMSGLTQLDAQQAAVNATFARAAYEQDVHARKLIQAQIAHNAAARRVEDCARTAFIVCVVTALTIIARAALVLIR